MFYARLGTLAALALRHHESARGRVRPAARIIEDGDAPSNEKDGVREGVE